MNPLLKAVLVTAIVASPALAIAGKSEPAGAEPIPTFSSVDLLVITIGDLDAWMAEHRVRSELRDMNRGMLGICEELRDVEGMQRCLSADRQFRGKKARVEELKRFQASTVLVARELAEWQTDLREIAVSQAYGSEPASDRDRRACQDARVEIASRVSGLLGRFEDLNARMQRDAARAELRESSASLGAALQRLHPVIQALDRLNEDPGLNHDCLSQIRQAQERLAAMVRQLETCHDCLTGLARS